MSRSAYRRFVADDRRTTLHVPDTPGRFSIRGIWVWNVLLWAVTAFIVFVPETAFEWASGRCGDRPVGAEPLHWVVHDQGTNKCPSRGGIDRDYTVRRA